MKLAFRTLAAVLFAAALNTAYAGAIPAEVRFMVKQPLVVNMGTMIRAGCTLNQRHAKYEFVICPNPPRGEKRQFVVTRADGSGTCLVTYASPPVASQWVEAGREIRMEVSTQGPCTNNDRTGIPPINWAYAYNITATTK